MILAGRLRIKIILFGILISFSCCNTLNNSKVQLIAEWEPQKEVWIGFRTRDMGPEFEYATIRMIRAISEKDFVKVIIQDSTLLPEGKSFFVGHDCDTSNIEIVFDELCYFWARDPGPIFYRYDDGGFGVADFRFGYYANLDLDTVSSDKIPMELYDRNIAQEFNYKTIESNLSIEGGGFETNGNGTVILVESVLLNRNPGWSKDSIEQELNDKFDVQTVIWLPRGLAEDPDYMKHLYGDYYGFGTGGHSDEFVRFVNDSTIFLAWEFSDPHPDYPLREKNIQRMEVNYSILQSTKDWQGKSLTIVKIPIPEIFYKVVELDEGTVQYLQQEKQDFGFVAGDRINVVACAGYLNYLITNNLVIIPKYWSYSVPEVQQEKDSLVLALFQQYYPERKIMQINPLVLNYAGGGMHCIYFSLPLQDENL